jgi:hypothetical protein
MAKKLRGFIALILVVVMALSLYGISAMAVVTPPADVVTITVTDGANPIAGAHVTLSGPYTYFGETDANGTISFTEQVIGYYNHSNTTVYTIAVTKAGYVDGTGEITVTDDWFVNGNWSYGDEDQYGYGSATVELTALTYTITASATNARSTRRAA